MNRLFGTRRKRQALMKSCLIDRRKTPVGPSFLDDSSEESCASTTSVSSDSESEYQSESSRSESSDDAKKKRAPAGDDSETEDRGTVSRTRRKRPSTTVLDDTSSNSDSDVGSKPVRRSFAKKRAPLESQLPDPEIEVAAQKKAKEVAAKRKERQHKLLELSRKRRSRTWNSRRRLEDQDPAEQEAESDEDDDDDDDDGGGDQAPKGALSASEEEADSNSLKDFIVEEEEPKGDKEEGEEPQEESFLSQLPRQFVTGSQLNHFQVVVKALLINALDGSFLKSLYEGKRTKRYAQEMKSSLFHFDERVVLPRLENLKQRSRWSDRYKERVECYPKARIFNCGIQGQVCEACELHRTCSIVVCLSGQLYHNDTLNEDHFMPDDTQKFHVGSVCGRRTEVYHELKHFKYHLFQHCRAAVAKETKEEEEHSKEEEEPEEEPVKETVSKIFTKLLDSGWISEQYGKFEGHLNDADFFQEEKLD